MMGSLQGALLRGSLQRVILRGSLQGDILKGSFQGVRVMEITSWGLSRDENHLLGILFYGNPFFAGCDYTNAKFNYMIFYHEVLKNTRSCCREIKAGGSIFKLVLRGKLVFRVRESRSVDLYGCEGGKLPKPEFAGDPQSDFGDIEGAGEEITPKRELVGSRRSEFGDIAGVGEEITPKRELA